MMAKLTVRAELESLATIADFLATALEGSTDEVLFSVQLAVDEACSNTILYGYPGGEAGSITIVCTVEDDTVHVTIADDGVAFDPLTAPPPLLDIPAEERPIGGLGVHFIRTVMDSVAYTRRDERNILSMKKRRPASF